LAFSPSSFKITGTVEMKASRREILQTVAAPLLVPSVVQAMNADSITLEKGLVESRVLENVMSPPTFGMEGNDIYI